MEIGMKIYYEKATGNVILNTGERMGSVVETTWEQDFESYKVLAERVPETVGLIELRYQQYAQDFREAIGYRVNLETEELEFSYGPIDPEEPTEPVYQKPLTEQVAELGQENTLLKAQINAQSERSDFIEDVIAELAQQIYT